MRFSIISAALFATAMALPAISIESSGLEARDFNLGLKGPKFSLGKKKGSSSDDDMSPMSIGKGKKSAPAPSSDDDAPASSDAGDDGASSSFDVKGVIQGLDSDVKALTAQVNKFNGDSFAALDLMKAADTLLDHIKAGITRTKAGGKIAFADGLKILPVFTSFVPDTKKAMSALSSKKDALVKAGVAGVVVDKLTKIQEAGLDFDNAVVAQLDLISKPFGKGVYKPVDTALKAGVDEFKNLPAGGGAGAAAAGGAAAGGDDDAAAAAAIAAADAAA